MNVLLLGNGYDLNYKLPTSYRSFLLTIDFLVKHGLKDINSVGDVFGKPELNEQDNCIKESYEEYKSVYDKIVLDKDNVQKIIDISQNNLWFKYFIKSFNKNVGWIDFEREIAFVISCFESFFSEVNLKRKPSQACKTGEIEYIILESFDFFISKQMYSGLYDSGQTRRIDNKYTREYPLNSNCHMVDKEKIVRKLNEELNDFSYVLKKYLNYFVESTAKELIKQLKITQIPPLNDNDIVITFNYTNTYELFDSNTKIFHIHGNVNDKIVLGINPDKNDDIENVNTLFIPFKKYYQRAFYNTDVPYLRWMRDYINQQGGDKIIHLLVMGHSLDKTDEEVIQKLFTLSSQITILYYNETAKSQYIYNLVQIFGKNQFDWIRDEKRLEFLPLNMDFTEFSLNRNRSSIRASEAQLFRLTF